jgi:serine/threonine-protein kinase
MAGALPKPSRRPDADLLGQMAGEYKILRRIGAGGFGTVYEAEHPVLKRKAAVKVLHEHRDNDSPAVLRFFAEAQAASQIRHRHMVDIFSFGQLANGRHFYVMDLLEGASLDRFLKQKKTLDPGFVLQALRPIADALDALHGHGIVHRDVKPPNIFLSWESDDEVVPKLLDFGLVKLLSDAGVHTASGVPMGTPYYMSPEQCRGEKVDARSDVYAFGVICHELLSGAPPFTGDTPAAVLVAHVVQPPPRLSEARADLPASLDEPILHMLAKDPASRPGSVKAALGELERAARDAGLDVPEGLPHLPRTDIPHGEPEPVSSQGETDLASRVTPKTHVIVSRRIFGWVGGIALVAGAASVYSLMARPAIESEGALELAGPRASTSVATSVATSIPSLEAPAPVLSVRAAPTATLTLRGAPDGASVMLGDARLGEAPGPISVPYGDQPVSLTVTASGYQAKTVEIVLNCPVDLEVSLSKVPRARPKTPDVPADLENPF